MTDPERLTILAVVLLELLALGALWLYGRRRASNHREERQ